MTQSKKPDIILYGGPAAGKSTQANILIKKLSAAHLYMGGELRKIAEEKTPLGRSVKKIIDAGELVNAEVAGKIAENFIRQVDPNQRIVFDGYPRKLGQANTLLRILKKYNRDVIFVYIVLPIPVALERLSARAQSSDRTDDVSPHAIRTRVEIFQKEAEPLKDLFKGLNKYAKIDGSGTVGHVSREILKVVS